MGKHEERVVRLSEHLKENPKDYQAVIALLKARSDMIEHRQWLKMIERRKRVAEIRRQRKEKHDAEESNE